jgi:type IX secretion system substrate protein
MSQNLKAIILFRLTGKILLMTGMMFLASTINAQKITPTVTDGNSYKYGQNGIYIDMSIGELAIRTIKSPTQIITQGFLQPIYLEQPCAIPELVYYPNPVEKEVTLGAIDCDIYVTYVEAYDMFGKTVLVTKAIENKVDLSPIGVGVYILRVFGNEGLLLGNIKIIKTTV